MSGTTASPRSGARALSALAVSLLALAVVALPHPATARTRAVPIPAISVTAKPWVIQPSVLSARASIAGPTSMTGILTLDLFYEDPTCTSPPVETWEADISAGTAQVVSDAPALADTPGGYYWRASYPGGAVADAVASHCVQQDLLPAGTRASYPFDSWDEWVRKIFVSLLGRSPSTGEYSAWRASLAAGTRTPGDVVATIRRGTDHSTNVDPVARLYRAYFLRNPEAAGLMYWVASRRSGRTLPSVSQFFATSSEFTNRYGALTDAAFVNLVYVNVLGRIADAGGAAYWTGQLTGAKRSRGEVMLLFSESPENRRVTLPTLDVVVLNILLFGRPVTPVELSADAARLSTELITLSDYGNELVHRDSYTGRYRG